MRKIIIIGGSKGIGKAITESLLSNHQVINISRTPPEFQHQNLSHHTCDILTDELPSIEAADGLIYCPGSINLKPFNRLSIEDFRTDFEINVIGAVKTIQAYTKALSQSESASIVLFSTVATKLGMPFHASVATAKSAVEGLTKSVAADLAPKIRVNAIAPGEIETSMVTPDSKKMLTEKIPMKRFGTPEEVAGVIHSMCSETFSYVNGTEIQINGGQTV